MELGVPVSKEGWSGGGVEWRRGSEGETGGEWKPGAVDMEGVGGGRGAGMGMQSGWQ